MGIPGGVGARNGHCGRREGIGCLFLYTKQVMLEGCREFLRFLELILRVCKILAEDLKLALKIAMRNPQDCELIGQLLVS